MVYYNEFHPFAARWLRELIKQKLIPDGFVDERSITEVKPEDLKEFTQCHFFAGIGGWSYALKLANVSADFPIWTGSCPCQPFSTAGQKTGLDDERHLFPVFFDLIKECKPPVVIGEQVESAIKFGWLDAVQDALESENYAFASVGLSASCVGAPHIRKRLYWGGYWTGWRTPTVSDSIGGVPHQRWWSHLQDFPSTVKNRYILQAAFGHLAIGEPERTGKHVHLNPRFSAWLMGFPIEWNNCAVMVTP